MAGSPSLNGGGAAAMVPEFNHLIYLKCNTQFPVTC